MNTATQRWPSSMVHPSDEGQHTEGTAYFPRDAVSGKAHPSDDGQHTEGAVARTIEQQTAKIPSDVFLWAACGSIVGSLALQCVGRQHASLFVGQWAPTLLILGLYNKLVKVAGSDRQHSL